MMTPREEDLQAVKDAVTWMRKLYVDGLHEGFIDAVGENVVLDVLLRLERTKERMKAE